MVGGDAKRVFQLFAAQIAGLPPALRATPLINAGGKGQREKREKTAPSGDGAVGYERLCLAM
jgi:hypothetical protein